MFYRQLEMPLGDAYAVAGKAIACDFVGEDGKEGVDAFLGKRPPRWNERSLTPLGVDLVLLHFFHVSQVRRICPAIFVGSAFGIGSNFCTRPMKQSAT